MTENAKVIVTSFRDGREVRDPNMRTVQFTDHCQIVPRKMDVFNMMKKVVEIENDFDAGIPVDTIIVNNDAGFQEGNDWIKSINGQKTRNGNIIAYTRKDIGWSFGGFNDAYELHNDYKNWLFTEDDIIVGGDNYYKKLIDRWNILEGAQAKPGYLSLVKVIKHRYGVHCGGGIGFTTKPILEHVKKHYGYLPHYRQEDNPNENINQQRQNNIEWGEVKFTNIIDEIGFHLFDYGPNDKWSLKDNLCLPYYDYTHK